jgi:hypothetical protein
LKRIAPLLLATLAACDLDLADGRLLCNHAGKACPDGYHCAADDRCWRNGHEPDLAGTDLGGVDAGAPDLRPRADGQSVPEVDCLDGQDDNGDGLSDCADPTCADRVACVGAPDGDELGLLALGTCPSGWETAQSYYRDLVSPTSCSGCTCKVSLTCRFDFTFYGTQTNCTSPTSTATLTLTGVQGDPFSAPTNCTTLNVSVSSPKSVFVDAYLTDSTCSHDASGATPDAVHWNTATLFCRPPRTSSTCGAGKLCVPLPPGGQNVCARVPTPSASCPAGYGGVSNNWYTMSQFTDPRTCTCDCAPHGGDCKGQTTFAFGSSCPVADTASYGVFASPPNVCEQNGGFNSFATNVIVVGYHQQFFGAENATCTNTGTAVGKAAPANGSTICCP